MLSWLKVSPKFFQRKLNKDTLSEKESSSMELGSMIHLALLEPGKFTVSQVDKPTGKMGAYCDALIAGHTPEEAKQISGFSYSLETIEKKYEGLPAEYVKERLDNQDKIYLDSRTKFLVDRCVDSILQGKETSKLIMEENALNELEIYWEKEGVKKKSKVDKLILTHLDEGIVFNVDVKTTSSNIYLIPNENEEADKNSYMHSYIKYGYHRQQAMYDEGIKHYIRETYGKDVQVVHLHVVVNTQTFECTVYKFTDKWIEMGKRELEQLIDKYRWHTETNYWESPKEFIDGIVKV